MDYKTSRDQERWTAQAMRWIPLMWVAPVTTIIGWGIGRLLDHLLGTDYLYLVFLLAGIGVGLWMLVRSVNRLEQDK
jgi:F0F1-type ATP synthase assembly protein I